MRNIIIAAIIAGALALFASCAGRQSPVAGADDASADAPMLADETDSLSYYLALSLAEKLRDRIGTDSILAATDYDPELLNSGIQAVLAVPAHHPGFQYGASHGASLQSQLMIFRSVDYPVCVAQLTAGFRRGITTDSADTAPQQALDRLMSPVNSLIIQRKLREHLNQKR